MNITARHMKIGKILLLFMVCILPFRHVAAAEETQSREGNTMKIRLTVNGKQLIGTLADNETARDFASLLPLTVTLEDHADTEKITYLPRKLSAKGAPSGSDPSVGDIASYAPWGNLALFYKDFPYSKGLVILGKIDGGVEVLTRSDNLKATIELVR